MAPARSEPKSTAFAVIAVGFAVLLFLALPPLWKSGLWEPYELSVADLARRLALNLFGAKELALSGADNGLPYLNDLGRPQLPFTSIALGFRLFGLHEWAGRLPLALWGVAGVAAIYGALARLFDRRAGLYAAIALATMPAYLVQSRTMMGEITTMASVAIAFSGLSVAAFDSQSSGGARVRWLLLGGLGLVAGYASRGAILGVMVPCLAVGFAKLAEMGAGTSRTAGRDGFGRAMGALVLLVGVVAAAVGAAALGARTTDVSAVAGGLLRSQSRYPTFDFYIGHIGHALAPWSAFAPFAFGRLFVAPASEDEHVAARETRARAAVLLGGVLACAAHAWLAPKLDLIAFTGPVFVAAACGIALRDFELGAHPSIALAVATLVLAGVLHHDFHELPDKAYQAFGVVGAAFPESFKDRALALWWVALGGFGVLVFLTWVERDPERAPFDSKVYARVAEGLREVWDGTVVLMWLALVAGLSVASLVVWFGLRGHWRFVAQLGAQLRGGLVHGWWVALLAPPLIIFGTLFACDTWLWAFAGTRRLNSSSLTRGFEPFENVWRQLREASGSAERLVVRLLFAPLLLLTIPLAVGGLAVSKLGIRPGLAIAIAIPSGVAAYLVLGFVGDLVRGKRSAAMAFFAGLIGVVMSLFYYPALANQLSPKDVFETYQRVHKGAEPLGLFGVGGKTAAYYAGGQPPSFTDSTSAHKWLTGGGERRFLAVKADELPRLNMAFREGGRPRVNLPVVDGRSSQILLVSSSLEGTEKNQNPFADRVLTAETAPALQRRLDANLDDKLMVLGIDVADKQGRLVDTVKPGEPYTMRTTFQVLATVGSEWEFFIHVDGYRKRHNGDHKVMGGKYPMAFWLPGDVFVDEHELRLEPNFTPGQYTIFFGLFVGDTRFKVKSGPSDGDNRINGGTLRVQ